MSVHQPDIRLRQNLFIEGKLVLTEANGKAAMIIVGWQGISRTQSQRQGCDKRDDTPIHLIMSQRHGCDDDDIRQLSLRYSQQQGCDKVGEVSWSPATKSQWQGYDDI